MMTHTHTKKIVHCSICQVVRYDLNRFHYIFVYTATKSVKWKTNNKQTNFAFLLCFLLFCLRCMYINIYFSSLSECVWGCEGSVHNGNIVLISLYNNFCTHRYKSMYVCVCVCESKWWMRCQIMSCHSHANRRKHSIFYIFMKFIQFDPCLKRRITKLQYFIKFGSLTLR